MMREPTPGLRPFRNKTKDVAKVFLVIPAGDVVEVSDDVAAQLGRDFAPVELFDDSAPLDEVEDNSAPLDEVEDIDALDDVAGITGVAIGELAEGSAKPARRRKSTD